MLPRRGARECRAVIERSAETAIIEQTFRRTVEHDAHAVEQINDSRRRFAHTLYERLICQEIPAINRVVKMFRGGVAFALLIFCGVDSALRAN